MTDVMRIFICFLLPRLKIKVQCHRGRSGKLTDELKEEFDYILVDCPAGIEQGFQNAIAGAERAS